MDVFDRTAHVLLQAASEEDGRMITPALMQQDIADEVGSSREMVSRILKDLKAGDYMFDGWESYRYQQADPDRW